MEGRRECCLQDRQHVVIAGRTSFSQRMGADWSSLPDVSLSTVAILFSSTLCAGGWLSLVSGPLPRRSIMYHPRGKAVVTYLVLPRSRGGAESTQAIGI